MRAGSFLLPLLLLTGCAAGKPWGVIDPAPFDPTESQQSYDYTNLADAKEQMTALAAQYAEQRNYMLRGTLLFDVPLLGLAATLAVAAGNHFASTTIAGMSVASVGTLGARTYLGPTGRASAYGAAAMALQCGAAGATRLERIRINEAPTNAYGALVDRLKAAQEAFPATQRAGTAEQATTAGAAISDGQKASKDLAGAIASIDGATGRLGFLASSIVRNTTKKVTTGVQDVGALINQLQSLTPSTGGTSPGAKPEAKVLPPLPPEALLQRDGGRLPKGQGKEPPEAGPDYSKYNLEQMTAVAQGISKDVSEAWSDMMTCVVISATQ